MHEKACDSSRIEGLRRTFLTPSGFRLMLLSFLDRPTRHLFFTGKGGVGKTSIACASAVHLADRGERVLLVSTDPASNLGQVFGAAIGPTIASVPGVARLSAVNIEPDAAAAAYRERILAPLRGSGAPNQLPQLEEQLSGACTTEIAAFDEFTRLLVDPQLARDFSYVIFDTAPTGHTIRLLQLPAAWSTFIDDNPGGASCLGPASGLTAQQAQYADTVRQLADPASTTIVLVTRPEASALKEAARTSAELAALGIRGQRVVVNGLFTATDPRDPLAMALQERGAQALAAMPPSLRQLPSDTVPLRPANVVGVPALRAFLGDDSHELPPATVDEPDRTLPPPLAGFVDELARQDHGLVMVMGKGGVGKTTIAAAVAVELASRGVPVHLSTTDPAAHIANVIDEPASLLTISRIDPAVETQRYIDRALATRGKHLDDDARRLLAEDLRSPCTEEVAVFHAFSRLVNQARGGFVVLDTAPTGHTLLLLDTAGSYHREVLRTSSIPAERITTPLMRVQDAAYTKILIVTLPETTPVLEAAGLQAELRRAGVEPFGWVINQSLAAAGPTDPLLRARAEAEFPLIATVEKDLARRTTIVPMQAKSPAGQDALRILVSDAGATDAVRSLASAHTS
ncbi:MAG: arsenical pump-driving ATPase [Gemmatimonadaceae bacterium]